MPNMKKLFLAAGIVLFVLLVVAGGWYFATRQNVATESTDTNQTAPSSTSQPAEPKTTKTYNVMVYFSKHPESDDDPGLTFPVHRTTHNLGVATFAMTELLKGPTATEATRGYFTMVKLRPAESTCSGKDFQLIIKDSVARLTFCKPFDHIGSVSDGQAESAIKATLDQFESVSKVVLLNNKGSCEFDLSGENRCLQ